MPGVTIPSERPGLYDQKMEAMVGQYTSRSRRPMSQEKIDEYRVICKNALIKEAEDKIEFSLRGEIRRGKPKKMGVTEQEFSHLWRTKMKDRLKADGYPFVLSKEDKVILEKVTKEVEAEKVKEITQITAEALRQMITTV